MIKQKHVLLVLMLLSTMSLWAQTQWVRGTVRDKETTQPIVGAVVSCDNSTVEVKTSEDGSFAMELPLGRQNLTIKANGYKLTPMSNVVVTSGREVIVTVDLEDEVEKMADVNIKAKKTRDQPNNDAALVSARLFTVDETDRFAGSRGDPARMASNFAGVQGADDSRNDIVIRGNSPAGVLWRLEGIDIPNPNHFAIPGTTGGPVSIINNKMLANSDFFTGAFPAEYGNAVAGAFDLKMRNGNNKKHEMSSQVGIMGWDFMAEGPLNKKSKASYLFTGRYSTLKMFQKLHVPLGTNAIPSYFDGSFKLNFPLKKNASFSVFGIGGASNIAIMISESINSGGQELYGQADRDQYFATNMYVLGATYQKPLSPNSYIKVIASTTRQNVDAHHNLLEGFKQISTDPVKYSYSNILPFMGYNYNTQTAATHTFINQKLSPKASLKYGIQYTHYMYSFIDTVRNMNIVSNDYMSFDTRWNAKGTGDLFIPYIQMKYKFSEKLTGVMGVQSQIFRIGYSPRSASSFQKDTSSTSAAYVLPRFSLRYQLDKKSSFNLGTGIHAQNQSPYIYFYDYHMKVGDTNQSSHPKNIGMGLTKSAHVVLGWDYSLGKASRIKMETYYQYLWNIPIDKYGQTSFSLANTGSGFSRFFPNALINKGVGYNYGFELTLEKFFSGGFYYLFSGSVFNAQYQGSDQKWRSTDFNTNYAMNALFAKEITFKNKNAFNFGGKITMAGARRYSPMDSTLSKIAREYVEDQTKKNTDRFGQAYFRLDFRLSYKINSKKMSHEIAIDLINVTNQKNILKQSYNVATGAVQTDYQLGFLPLFYYKLDFSL